MRRKIPKFIVARLVSWVLLRLFQRRYLLEFLCLPNLHQGVFVECEPFLNHAHRFGRKMTFKNLTRHKIYSSNILVVDCVNVRRIMFALQKVHSNYNDYRMSKRLLCLFTADTSAEQKAKDGFLHLYHCNRNRQSSLLKFVR